MENTETGKKDDGSKQPPEIMMNETQPDQRHADAQNGRGFGQTKEAGANKVSGQAGETDSGEGPEAGKYGDDEERGHKPGEQVANPKEYTKKEGPTGQDKSAAV